MISSNHPLARWRHRRRNILRSSALRKALPENSISEAVWGTHESLRLKRACLSFLAVGVVAVGHARPPGCACVCTMCAPLAAARGAQARHTLSETNVGERAP